MVIKDILDTPIDKIWDAIGPFVIGYSIFTAVIFVVILSVTIFLFFKVLKGMRRSSKEFDELLRKKKNLKK